MLADDEELHSRCSEVRSSIRRLQDAIAPQTGPSTDNIFFRILWVIVYVCLITVMCHQGYSLGRLYLDYPTAVEVEIVSRNSLNFPAVTVCNNNPVRKSLIGRIRDHEDLVFLDDYVMRSVLKFAEYSFQETDFQGEICKESEFTCENGKHCIPKPWVCNGIDNCDDGSDENLDDCEEIMREREISYEVALNSSQGICQDGYIQCPGEKFCATPCDNHHECSRTDAFDESVSAGCEVSLCAENLTASSSEQFLTSPGFESSYTENMNCSWMIKAPKGQVVHITFKEVSIEGEMGGCSYDFLQLRDGSAVGSPVIKVDGKTRVCGPDIPKRKTYTSTNETLTIIFRTDDSQNMKGYRISFKAMVKNSRTRRQTDLSFTDLVLVEKFSSMSKKKDKHNVSHRSRRSDISDSDYSSEGGSLDYGKNTTDSSESGDYANYYSSGVNDYNYDYNMLEDSYDEDDMAMQNPGDGMTNKNSDKQFYGLDSNDYFSLYQASLLPDFSDFRSAVVLHKDLIKLNGHQKGDFIIQCTFDGHKCSEDFFKTYQDPFFGNCFSFNSIRDRNLSEPLFIRKTSKTGQEYGLKLSLFVDVEEYIGVFTHYSGARVLIHDALMNGRVRAESLSIATGEATFLAVSQNRVERVGGRYSDCAETERALPKPVARIFQRSLSGALH